MHAISAVVVVMIMMESNDDCSTSYFLWGRGENGTNTTHNNKSFVCQ